MATAKPPLDVDRARPCRPAGRTGRCALRTGPDIAGPAPQSRQAQYSCAGGTFHHSMSWSMFDQCGVMKFFTLGLN